MWGGVVESENNGAASAAAAWGGPVAGSTGGDSSWMGSGNGGQTGWGSGGTGPTSSKSGGWDAQQQQTNLVAAAGSGGQSAGNSWQAASNGVAQVNGWTGSGAGGQTNWNTGSGQQQWTGTSPGGGSTWAGVAGRHASTTSATPQTPIQQGAMSNTGPVVTTPTAAAVRPKGTPSGFEAVGGSGGAVGWGKPIDQGTPWEVRAGGGDTSNTFGNAPSSGTPSAHWSGNGGGNGGNGGGGGGNGGANWNTGGTQHSGSGGNISRENSWQGQPSDGRDGRVSYGGYGGGKPVRDGPQWNAEGGSGWDSMPANQRHGSSSGNMWGGGASGMDSQQREQPANVWTGPPAPMDVADSHMIWTNPYPKKTAQPDKGTSTWGDPTSQGDIKRWKTNNEGDLLPALTVLQASASSNVQNQSGAGAGNGNSGMAQAQQTAASGTPAWKDPSTPTQQPKTPSWASENVGQTSSSTIPSPTSAASGWGDGATPTQSQISTGSTTKPSNPYDRDGITTAGWTSGNAKPAPPVQLLTKSCSWTGIPPGLQQQSGFGHQASQHQHAQADASRNSIESDGGNVSDDVFSSNPTTPMSAGAGPPGQPGSTLILNKQQQQLPNGLGHSGSASSQNLNQLVSKLGVQNAQMNLAFNANASGAGGAGGRPPQQLLTQQIADQLKAAVRAGLIDIGILHQPLPQETLLRLNQLLQCVPKLDQAQKEMLQLQTQSANQPQGLNPAQQAEYQRISNEVKQLRQTMSNLKQAISAQTQNANPAGGQQQGQMRNGAAGSNAAAAGAAGDGGQSKLEQWKRGSTNGVINGAEAGGNGTGNAVFGVGLSANANDPWSNTPAKRNSGVDWPQSPATTPGDMPKSPDKHCEGNKENDSQQQQENGNRMPTPGSAGSGNEAVGSAGATSMTTPTLLDDVPEFKPGQPWNWRDPKELAEDPDATPGSVKRPALISVNSDFFGGGTSPSSGGHLGGNAGSDLMGAAALAAGLSAMNFGSNNPAMMGGGGYQGFGGSGMMPSNFYGQNPAKMSGPGGYGGQQGLGDSWPSSGGMPRASRPPSQMSQPIGGRAPFKHSMSTPNASSAAGFMPPYNMGASAPAQWIVLTNCSIDEPSLQLMMSRIAPVHSCMAPHGAGFGLVKFKDVSLDKVLPRLQQECSAVGLTIQLAKDDEVSRLIQAVTGQRAGGHSGGAGHLFGPPPPPPHHHPGAMGPAIWDAPPPQGPGPWGPPPPPQGTGLHHHGAGGPFGPHPGALNDPTVAAATAMSMPMPPGMHDGGLFAPVGHDRHAPF